MRKRIVFLISAVILMILTASAAVSAQTGIDLDNMDNAQLMALLQAIMLKLEQNEAAADPAENAGELPVPTAVPTAVLPDEPVPAAKRFHVYENKKLIVEALPDSYFIRKDTGEGGEPSGPTHYCKPGCSWDEVFKGCVCG